MSLIYDPSAIRYTTTQTAYGTTWTLNKVEDDGAQVWKSAKGQEAVVQKACEQVRQSPREWRVNTDDKDYGIDWINKRIVANYPPTKRELGTPDDTKGCLPSEITSRGNHYIQSLGRDVKAIASTGAKMFVHDEAVGEREVLLDKPITVHGGHAWNRALTAEEVATIWKKGPDAIPGGTRISVHDFYQEKADEWGCTRNEAKNRLLANTYGTGSVPLTSDRVYSTKENESNGPKNDKACGMFAGKSYPYRKSCRKPNEGDRSVSAADNFLYEYRNKEWWVIGQFGNFLVKPERANIYFNRTDNGRWEMPVSRAGDMLSNTRIAGDGTTNLRWDGLKWRNVK